MRNARLVIFDAAAGELTGGVMKNRVLPLDVGIVVREDVSVLYFKIVEYGFFVGRTERRGYRVAPLPDFPCYGGYSDYAFQPTDREYHLLMAGETVTLSAQPKDA